MEQKYNYIKAQAMRSFDLCASRHVTFQTSKHWTRALGLLFPMNFHFSFSVKLPKLAEVNMADEKITPNFISQQNRDVKQMTTDNNVIEKREFTDPIDACYQSTLWYSGEPFLTQLRTHYCAHDRLISTNEILHIQ